MRVLNPRSMHNPPGWRKVYAEFQSFRTLAHKLGEPVESWAIQYPTTIRERIKGIWQLQYTLNCKNHVVYIGYNPETAAIGLRKIHQTYPRHSRKGPSTKRPAPKKPDPLTDPGMVSRIISQWHDAVARVNRGELSEAEYKRQFRYHNWLLDRRAGVLPMTMYQYVQSSMYRYWPSPPLTQQSLQNRLRELEAIAREKEKRAR